jgi:hypothetical protein
MSKKRGMSKQQRLYYEYQNKDRIKEQLQEIGKQTKEIEDKRLSTICYNPHQNSYYN